MFCRKEACPFNLQNTNFGKYRTEEEMFFKGIILSMHISDWCKWCMYLSKMCYFDVNFYVILNERLVEIQVRYTLSRFMSRYLQNFHFINVMVISETAIEMGNNQQKLRELEWSEIIWKSFVRNWIYDDTLKILLAACK